MNQLSNLKKENTTQSQKVEALKQQLNDIKNEHTQTNIVSIIAALSEVSDLVAQHYLDKKGTTYNLIHDWTLSTRSSTVQNILINLLNNTQYEYLTGNNYQLSNSKNAYSSSLINSLSYNATNTMFRQLYRQAGKRHAIKLLAEKTGYNNLPDTIKIAVREGMIGLTSHSLWVLLKWGCARPAAT